MALQAGIEQCRPGQPFAAIGDAIQTVANRRGYTVNPQYCGHGIGNVFHCSPFIFHVKTDYRGEMQPGMTFTIEPILCQGDPVAYTASDHWSACSQDGLRAAQMEQLVVVTHNGARVLTDHSRLDVRSGKMLD